MLIEAAPTHEVCTAAGCFISAAERDEEVVTRYIMEQEAEDKQMDQQEMFKDNQSQKPPVSGSQKHPLALPGAFDFLKCVL
jgi:hypothetical protein